MNTIRIIKRPVIGNTFWKKIFLFTLAIVLLTMGGCGGDAGSAGANQPSPPSPSLPPATPPQGSGNFISITTPLTGGESVPSVSTAATGTGIFNIDLVTGVLTGSAAFSNLSSNSTVAHIHNSAAGTNGPIVVSLIVSFEGGIGGPSGTFFVPPNTVLTLAQMDLLRADLLYWNIHSLSHPDGEIRGQILFP